MYLALLESLFDEYQPGATSEALAIEEFCMYTWLLDAAHANPPATTHPRNRPYPCGSGIKYKRCCGAPAANAAAAGQTAKSFEDAADS